MFKTTRLSLMWLLAWVLAMAAGPAWASSVQGTLAMPDTWTVFLLPAGSEKLAPDAAWLTNIPQSIQVQGQAVQASAIKVEQGRLDLAPLFGGVTLGNTAHVMIRLHSPRKQTVTLGMGADWWLQAWVNGKQIVNTIDEGNTDWPPHMTNHVRTVALKQGVNILAIRFISGSGSSVLTVGGPQELGRIPTDQWRAIASPSSPRTSFAMPRAQHDTRGIDDLGQAVIVLPAMASVVETTAASELAHYLGLATGREIPVITEPQAQGRQHRIHVGDTRHAQRHGVDIDALPAERWLIRSVNGGLILTGGRARGILYATYHFLEKVVGVRWWNPWEEHVPRHATLPSGELDLTGEPAFKLRHLNTYGSHVTAQGAERAWAPRNRVNLELHMTGKPPMSAEHGGGVAFGPPAFVHSESHYYRAMRQRGVLEPSWVALRDGQRVIRDSGSAESMQLCTSNQAMRQAFLTLLLEHIARTRSWPVPPTVFDVSFNDISTRCQCEDCNALAKRYGQTDAGLMLDFVNFLADHVKATYPDVLISTLAYMNTESLPQGIAPRDNVVIVLCDTTSTYTAPLAGDGRFAQLLAGWSRIAPKVSLWDYHTTFADYAIPMPFERSFQADLQLFHKNSAWGVMTEYHQPILEDMRDLRLWLLAKLYEDPHQDLNRLIMDFTEGYYGQAGAFIRQYLAQLNEAAVDDPGVFHTKGMLERAAFLTPDRLVRWQGLFDQAQQAVADDPTLLRRVSHARLALDKATHILWPRIETLVHGKPAHAALNRPALATRIQATLDAQAQLRSSNLVPYSQRQADAMHQRFLEFLQEEILWENCDNLARTTWGQAAWSPRWFKKEEVGQLTQSTDIKHEGTGSIRWTVTADDVRRKLQEQPDLKVIRMNYLHGSDFARNRIIKFHLYCDDPNHPPLYASLTGNHRPIRVLDRGEVTDGWKAIVWDLGQNAGQSVTHLYFRLHADPADFKPGDVLDIRLDNMRLVR